MPVDKNMPQYISEPELFTLDGFLKVAPDNSLLFL